MKRKLNLVLGALLQSALCLSLAAVFAPRLSAQTTYGSIAGTVADSSGAAISDAQVTLTNIGTAEKRVQQTGSDGLYSFVNLLPGRYRIDAEKTGFKRTSQPEVVVQVQQTSSINLTMQVGDVTQTVEVTSETPLLQPDSASLGQVIDERKTNEIPLNGRNVFNLITLSPAAIAQGGSGGSQVGQNPFSWGNYQVGGSFGNESAEYIDGQPVNIGYINLPVLIPDQDSISPRADQTSITAEHTNISAIKFLTRSRFSRALIHLMCRTSLGERLAVRSSKKRPSSSSLMTDIVSGQHRYLRPQFPLLQSEAVCFLRIFRFTIRSA